MIVASEIFGMPRTSVEMLSALNRPIGTLDATTMGPELVGDPFLMPEFRSELALPADLFFFRPCPLNDLTPDSASTFHGPAFPDACRVTRNVDYYRILGLDPAKKVALLPIAPWAEYFAQLPTPPFAALKSYHSALVARVAEALTAFREPVQLAVVANRPPAASQHRSVTTHPINLIPFDWYDHLLRSCDLVISDNIIGASLAKAMCAGVPHLVIANTVQSAQPYEWNIFPLRQRLPNYREWARIVDLAEFSQPDDISAKLEAIATNGFADPLRNGLREQYRRRVRTLPSFAHTMEKAVGRPGRTVPPIRPPSPPPPVIVFYLEIWFSFGEREHALALARRLRRVGYDPRFVVDGRVADHIRSAGFEASVFQTPAMGVKLVEALAPILIVGCELFNLSDESLLGLRALGRPLATVDGTSMGRTLNSDPFHEAKLTRDLKLPETFWSFRPCPVNDPLPPSPDVICYNLFAGAKRVPKDETLYRSYGLDPLRRTILLPIAGWAISSAALFKLDFYHDLLIERVVAGVASADIPSDLLVVGLPLAPTPVDFGNVRKLVVSGLPYPAYDHILTSCDLVIADNIIQTSVSKALSIGTPHLIIQNLAESEVRFRCNIFPLKILFPADREYSAAVEVAEFGSPSDIREKLGALLERGYYDENRRIRRRELLARIAALPDPAVAVEGLLQNSALASR